MPSRSSNDTGDAAASSDLEQLRARVAELEQRLADERRAHEQTREELRNLEFVTPDKPDDWVIEAERMSLIGQMSAGIIHEIGNALNFVGGNQQHLAEYVEAYEAALSKAQELLKEHATATAAFDAVMRERDLDFIRADMPKLLDAMKTGVDRAVAIMRDLGQFSRGSQATEPVDLGQPMEVALTLATNALKRKVSVVRERKPAPSAVCNPGQISQVYLNLLLNAAAAIENRGEVHISFEERGDSVVTIVRDTGHGILPEHRDKIFDAFFTTKEHGKGTGLGMFVCKTIIDAHEGKIWFDTEPGRGTTFYVSLPREGPKGRS